MAKYGKHTLKVGSKSIELTFSLWALRMACKELGITLEQMMASMAEGEDGQTDIFGVLDFFACTMVCAANENLPSGTVKYTIKQGYDWIETLGFQSPQLQATLKVLMESTKMAMGGPAKEVQATADTDEKKALSLPGTK